MSKVVIYYIDKQTKKREDICSFHDSGKLDDDITNNYIADEISKKFPDNFAIRSRCIFIAASLTGYGHAEVNQYKFGIER